MDKKLLNEVMEEKGRRIGEQTEKQKRPRTASLGNKPSEEKQKPKPETPRPAQSPTTGRPPGSTPQEPKKQRR